jgi:hypothetical protein
MAGQCLNVGHAVGTRGEMRTERERARNNTGCLACSIRRRVYGMRIEGGRQCGEERGKHGVRSDVARAEQGRDAAGV